MRWRGCPHVNTPWGTCRCFRLRQHRPFMSIKLFVQTQQVGQVTGDNVLVLSNPFNWHVCWPWPRGPLFLEQRWRPCGHSRGCLTHYCPHEARNSIYRCWKIYIDYRSKWSYRFHIDDNLWQHYWIPWCMNMKKATFTFTLEVRWL